MSIWRLPRGSNTAYACIGVFDCFMYYIIKHREQLYKKKSLEDFWTATGKWISSVYKGPFLIIPLFTENRSTRDKDSGCY